MKDTIKDFIGIFPNAASEEYCKKVITRFEYIQATRPTERGRVWTRQEFEQVNTIVKENDTYFVGGDASDQLPLEKKDIVLMDQDAALLSEFNEIIWKCYDEYVKKYGIMTALNSHKVSPTVRLQKYKPSQGYHVWHCDADNNIRSRRIIVITLYLNTVEDGGETEFLYQNVRVSPVTGTLVLFPGGWTHTHRGNPPLKGVKYILTTWLEY